MHKNQCARSAEAATDPRDIRQLFKTATDYREFGRQHDAGFCTLFEADHQIGKEFSLVDGLLTKRTLGPFGAGSYNAWSFEDADDFAELLSGVTTSQALTASTPRGSEASGRFVTKEESARHRKAIHRGKEHFGLQHGVSGVMTIDYDPEGTPLSPAELWATLKEVIPGVESAGAVRWVSGSSFIYNGHAELQGLSGQRIYILVFDAGDIPRAMGVLQKRLWLAGHGRVMVSKSGSILHRTIADESLGQDARLDYIGGAVLRDGLTQQRGLPEVISRGGWLDTLAALPDLSHTEESRYLKCVADAEREAAPVANAKREQWENDRSTDYALRASARGEDYAKSKADGVAMAKAALGGVLLGNFEITLDDGAAVAVSKILADREKYQHRLTLDPLEPGYRGGHAAGKLFLFGAVPNLFSFAHGGRVYRLSPQPERFLMQHGRAALDAQEYLRRLAASDDVFARGGAPVRACSGLRPLATPVAMGFELGTRFASFKLNAKGAEVPADAPDNVARMVVERARDELREIVHYVTHPFVTEREIVTTCGYHASSRTFADFDPSDYAGVPASPTRGQIVDALRTLWRPFEKFACAEGSDRAALLAAILGIVCRPGIDLAPGVLCDAPIAGSGKTLLAQTLAALSYGRSYEVDPFVIGETETELKKRIIAGCLAGRECLILDNVVGRFDSPVIAACLTSGSINDRILGASIVYSGPGPRHIYLTSNNMQLGPDLAVRFLRIRLDHKTASPHTIEFKFNPLERALSERVAVLRGALTVLSGFRAAGSPHHGQGSYRMPGWDRLVRSAAIWAGQFCRDAGIDFKGGSLDPAAGLLEATAGAGAGDEVKAAWFKALEPFLNVEKGTTAASILVQCAGEDDYPGDDAVRKTTLAMLGSKPMTLSTVRSLLLYSDGHIAGGYRLSSYKDADKALRFRLIPLDA